MTDSDKRQKITEAQLEDVATYREQGLSCQKISDKLGLSRGCIQHHCLRLGIESPKTASKVLPQTCPGPLVVMRNGRPLRHYTVEEDDKLIALDLVGKTYSQISREMGRTPNSVRGRLMILARHEERKAYNV